MSEPISLRVVIEQPETRVDVLGEAPGSPVAAVLARHRCLLVEPLRPDQATLPLHDFDLEFQLRSDLAPGTTLHPPTPGAGPQQTPRPTPQQVRQPPPTAQPPPGAPSARHPERITEEQATQLAHGVEIEAAASLLRADQSVLITCEKILVPHLAEHIVRRAGRDPQLLESDGEPEQPSVAGFPAPPSTLRQRLLSRLRDLVRQVKDRQVLVVPHLDLLGGGQDGALSNESRELIELLYSTHGSRCVLLAFADPSLPVPEVLASRFSTRIAIEGTPRLVHLHTGEELPSQTALITREEAAHFSVRENTDLYKFLAGLSPVRLRQAMRYAHQQHEGNPHATVAELRDTIRAFKAQQSSSFEIPDVSWDDIGGYDDVKAALERTLHIMNMSRALPDEDQHLRAELTPRGFIFYGPPGTGKTLFAKAVANKFNATIQIVSGPEVTNKFVGEGERRIRELFAEARRNAPSVIVFDEFDSIAARRGSGDDGGSRAGNAMVAQILTEMDGFRPDVQMLVIGTTNRLELIDSALLRPSRFASFPIDLPDDHARRDIIRVHARRYRVPVEGFTDALVRATMDWNGDEIRALFRDAFVAARYEGRPPTPTQLGELVGLHQISRKREHVGRRRV
ncbi:MAG: ATP-binding protein [Saccharothrix sp.]|jgi:transitional endoplasmic reticulum ATPase|nr:ATP-binding protein [Saccharothrix sp.]